MEPQRVTVLALVLPRAEDSPARARRALRAAAPSQPALEEALQDALLVATELVTNALVHGTGQVRLEVHLLPGALELAVSDQDRRLPVPRDPSRSAEGGRGVALVAALASDWGVQATQDGKRVWARLAQDRDGLATTA